MASTTSTVERFGANAGRKAGEAVEKAQETASGLIENVGQKAQDLASETAKMASDVASNVAQTAEHAFAATKETVGEVCDNATTFIRRNPIVVVLGALGLGCLIGMALSRR